MGWLISAALMTAFENSRSSPEQVEAFSAACSSDGEPFAPSSLTPTPLAFWSHGKTTAHSRLSRYGMTLERLTDDRGEALLTWYREDFRARTSAWPATAPASPARGRDSGESLRGLLGRFDRDTHSLRTVQPSLFEDSTECLQTLPRWGLMRDGELYRRRTLVHRTSANASGLWQTPTADDALDRQVGKWNSRGEPKLSAQVMIPTPKSNDAEKRGNFDAMNPRNGLPAFVMKWPTPTAIGAGSGRVNRSLSPNAAERPTLATLVRLPTPTVNDSKNNAPPSQAASSSPPLNSMVGGKLNPQFVEWMMGWPLNWTSMEPLPRDTWAAWLRAHECRTDHRGCEDSATDKCQPPQDSHGSCSHE